MGKLDDFEKSKKEVYQVTKSEWLDIMHDQHVIQCQRTEQEFNQYTKQEVECYHKQEVRTALENGITVSEKVLADYPILQQEVENKLKAKQERYNNQIALTPELLATLQQGNKIMVNGNKLTIHSKTENSIIARLYKSHNKAIELFLNDRFNSFVIGWKEKQSA